MNNRTTLSPQEARDYGLVHEVKSELFPIDSDLSVIGEMVNKQPQPVPLGVTFQPSQAYTKSVDLDFGTL